MAIFNTWSKRTKPLPNKDVLIYDVMPEKLRAQIVHIWFEGLGNGRIAQYAHEAGVSHASWEMVVKTLCKELGVFGLSPHKQYADSAMDWFMKPQPFDYLMDLVELTFRAMETMVVPYFGSQEAREAGITIRADEAVDDLNHRFMEHSLGYRYESGQIIRVDSTFTHAEVIKPTLSLLSDKRFKNAEVEFLKAHKNYREQRYSDCLNEALKAFESTMKIICHERGWKINQTDTSQKLIEAVLANGLVPAAHQAQFTSLRQLLESGTPTTRNKNSGHGAGVVNAVIPEYLAAYGLQTAAANINLLVSAFRGKV